MATTWDEAEREAGRGGERQGREAHSHSHFSELGGRRDETVRAQTVAVTQGTPGLHITPRVEVLIVTLTYGLMLV